MIPQKKEQKVEPKEQDNMLNKGMIFWSAA